MTDRVEYYGTFKVTSYQAILGVCTFVNCVSLVFVTLDFPNRETGSQQMFYILGLVLVVVLYRFVPLLGAAYGILPLIHPLLGRWVALPFFFEGISLSPFITKWVFAGTALVGYIWHKVDSHGVEEPVSPLER